MERRVWIQGVGRSGTSWFQKIFDQHPDVRAAFEPETGVWNPAAPDFPLYEGAPLPPDAVARYVDAIFATRHLRSVRRRPILPKAYRSRPAHAIRVGLIYAASAAQRFAQSGAGMRIGFDIPDLSRGPASHAVAKCVSQPYPIADLAKSRPEVKFIYLVRHPCGMVHSTLRGMELGKMFTNYLPNRHLLDRFYSFEAGTFDITEDDFSQAEILTYRWGVYNGEAVEAARHLPNLRLLRYEDLCADPVGVSREVFAWVGLDWSPRCEAFLAGAMAAEGDGRGYHSFDRKPLVAANKWRRAMPADLQRVVRGIAARSPAAKLFDDLAAAEVSRPTARAAAAGDRSAG